MSIEAVVGRIDQILQLQQQVLDPASLAGSSATPASTGAAFSSGAPAATTPSSTDFASALASAQAATGSTQSGVAPVTMTGGAASSDPRVTAMVNEANSLIGKPYVFGGGHSSWAPQAGYDCSGFVSAVLHAGGYLTSPADTTSLPSQAGMVAGPGQYVTVYDRALPGDTGHVIIEINGQFYESGGSHGAWGGGGGVQKIGTPSASYLATFTTVLHPDGL